MNNSMQVEDAGKELYQLSLITLPAEIACLIVDHLSSRDFVALRLVSKDFLDYFTGDHICRYAHKLYFGKSSEVTKDTAMPYHGFPLRSLAEEHTTRADFDNAYIRNRNWIKGMPTDVDIVDPVADGSVGCWSSIIVNPPEGLIVYQKSRGILIIKDISKKGPTAETVLDLRAILGDCITTGSRNLVLRDGQSIRLRLNRGRLFVAGEAHEHPPVSSDQSLPSTAANEKNRSGSWFWPWGYAHIRRAWNWSKKEANMRLRLWTPGSSYPQPANPIRQRMPHSTHTQCAVFSVRQEDRGRLISKWFETDNFLTIAALNEYYCISEFHLMEQRLEGIIYRPDDATDDGTPSYEPYHRFSVRKKTEYPSLSTFDIAPDTKGKVFYLGFLPPPDRRPVVEVISIPTKQNDGTWTQPTVIKRVVLRTLAKHVESLGAALLKSYWIDFDDGIEVTKETQMRASEGKNWRLGEDVVRLRLRGDFVIDGTTPPDECVKLVSWYVTARPSPRQPSTIQQWRNQLYWNDQWLNDPNCPISPWADATGYVDLEECYPTPTYYTMAYNSERINQLPLLPTNVDLDRAALFPFPSQYWSKDDQSRHTLVSSVLCSEVNPKSSDDSTYTTEPGDTLEYPRTPGRDDHHFVPPGRHLYAAYRVTLDTGRGVKSKRICERAFSNYKKAARTRYLDSTEKLSDKIWANHEAITSNSLTGSDLLERLQNDAPKHEESLEAQEQEEEDEQAREVYQNAEVYLPPLGTDNTGLKGVFDWRDRRFLVYGKTGSQPPTYARTDIVRDENVEDTTEKIVIVRYD